MAAAGQGRQVPDSERILLVAWGAEKYYTNQKGHQFMPGFLKRSLAALGTCSVGQSHSDCT